MIGNVYSKNNNLTSFVQPQFKGYRHWTPKVEYELKWFDGKSTIIHKDKLIMMMMMWLWFAVNVIAFKSFYALVEMNFVSAIIIEVTTHYRVIQLRKLLNDFT